MTTNLTPSSQDRNLNALRAGLQLGGPVGSAIERLLFGNADTLRLKRLENTLCEVSDRVRASAEQIEELEPLANLIEELAPAIGRETNEDKRRLFRNLLINAAHLTPNDEHWEDGQLAGLILKEISNAGIAILAAIERVEEAAPADTEFTLKVKYDPVSVIVDENGTNRCLAECAIDYSTPVVQHAVRQMRDADLLAHTRPDDWLILSDLGQMVVRWCKEPS